MGVLEIIKTRIEIREFEKKSVGMSAKKKILEAGRLAPSGRNLQHWHYILIEGDEELERLASLSPTGGWVREASFAIVTTTDPKYDFNEIDAGRSITQMQLVGWENGVGSRLYTIKKPDQERAKLALGIPEEYHLTAVVGFGYPVKKATGKKERKGMREIVSYNKFGTPMEI
jgi:nitroreductase|tara:strand:- start:1015 stop:1530 length:516 start_codon:yes stop_codon:yes gene_type:complete